MESTKCYHEHGKHLVLWTNMKAPSAMQVSTKCYATKHWVLCIEAHITFFSPPAMDLWWSLPLEPTFGHGFFPWLLTHLADGPLGCLPEIHPGWAALGLAPHCNVVDGLLSGEVALQRPLKFTWKA